MQTVSLKKNILLSTIYQILTMITPFITAPYISRVLEVDGLGIYSYVGAIQYYFSMLAALGTVSYGTREIARVRNNKTQRSILFWEIESLTIVTTMIALLLWTAYLFTQSTYRIYFVVYTFQILSVLFDISWFYAGLEQFEHIVLQNSICKILSIIAIFIFVREKSDLVLYILIMALMVFISNLTMWIYLPKYLEKVQIKSVRIKQHFRKTLVYFVPTIATSIYTVLDKTLIGVFTGDISQNGYYEQATKIINMVKAICFGAVNSVLRSRMSFLYAENKLEDIKEKIELTLNYTFFVGIGSFFGLLGVASRFVPFFLGNGYDQVVFLVWILSPISVIIGISSCLGAQYYIPTGQIKLSTKFLIIGSGVNLVANCILIPKFGSMGAAVATILAESIITILFVRNCQGYLSISQMIKHGWKKVVSGCIMLLLIHSSAFRITSDFWALFLSIILGALVYILLLVLIHDTFLDTIKIMIIQKIRKPVNQVSKEPSLF